jgi:hypothetical protein
MDAFVLNGSEKDLLMLARRMSEVLDIPVSVEFEGLKEGGVRSIWRLSNADVAKLTLLVAVLTLLVTTYPLVRDHGISSLQKRDLELSIKEHELNIEKLRKEIRSDESAHQGDTVRMAVDVLQNDSPTVFHRSAFYRKLSSLPKVVGVTYSARSKSETIAPEAIVVQDDFQKFVIADSEIPRLRDEAARIEVVAPVLKGGRIKWRGIYDGRPIDFHMRDDDFRRAVESREIVFKAGYTIECVLEMERRMSETGEEEIGRYAVVTVLTRIEDDLPIQTEQGKAFTARRASEKAQMKLWDAP